ncbi:MAG: CcdB family protein [Roseateles sp.]|uniref:CcdB family protein n=1 Tax=Roseateles sp. TaxID=1971397 RepID=UPI0039E9C792
MARFHVYRNRDGEGCLLDVQADLLAHLNTRVVVPLLPTGRFKPARQLNPVFMIDGEPHAMATQFMAAVPLAALGAEVARLAAEERTVVAALDCLFSGV